MELLPWLFSCLLYSPPHRVAVSARMSWKPAPALIVSIESLPSSDGSPGVAVMGVKGFVKAFTYFYLWSVSNPFSPLISDDS